MIIDLDQQEVDLVSSSTYGFNRQYQNVFSTFDAEYLLIFDNKSPDTLAIASIRCSRLKQEDFNFEYYLADKNDFDDRTAIMNYTLTLDDELTDQDRDDLKNLKYKQYIIDETIPIYLGLIDLLYAFVYDQRITQ
jgi:protein SHQ1